VSAPSGYPLARLLQLASPALPVGAYSYSQGLEAAVEAGTIADAQGALRWIGDALSLGIGRLEAPVLACMQRAWLARDHVRVTELNAWFCVTRETAELRAESLQMGYSLRRLFADLDGFDPAARLELERMEEVAFPTAYAFAAAQWRIPAHDALVAYLWSWLENQVMAALKAVPLGQTDGQRVLLALGDRLAGIAGQACAAEETSFANFMPGLAIASSRHETQYSRLFRS
jgi:urease accessory protein